MPIDSVERKLVFVDSKGETRSLRGLVTVQADGFVRVDRRDGHLLIPVSRVLSIEGWHGESGL